MVVGVDVVAVILLLADEVPPDHNSHQLIAQISSQLSMVAERERGLRAETLAAAPQHKLPARERTRAYLLTGLPGAGKSTVARLLALDFDRAAHIDIDLVFHHFTVSGLAEPSTPSDQAAQQAELAAARAREDAGLQQSERIAARNSGRTSRPTKTRSSAARASPSTRRKVTRSSSATSRLRRE